MTSFSPPSSFLAFPPHRLEVTSRVNKEVVLSLLVALHTTLRRWLLDRGVPKITEGDTRRCTAKFYRGQTISTTKNKQNPPPPSDGIQVNVPGSGLWKYNYCSQRNINQQLDYLHRTTIGIRRHHRKQSVLCKADGFTLITEARSLPLA